MGEIVRITGLRELNAALKRMDADLPKEIKAALNTASEELVRQASSKVPKRTGRAAGTYRAAATRTAARVRVGGARAKYVPWLEFGGEGRIKGRPSKRQFITEGRYLYPTLRKLRPEFEQALLDAIGEAVRTSGLEVDFHGG